MAVNKVKFGGNTLIDLTGDTLESAEQLLKGIIAHARDGSVITGLMEAGGDGTSFVTGSFTMAFTTNSYGAYFDGGIGTIDDLGITIAHNLGKIPKICVIMCETRPSLVSSSVKLVESAIAYNKDGVFYQYVQRLYVGNNTRTWSTSNMDITKEKARLRYSDNGCFLNATETEIFITCGGGGAGCILNSGHKYQYLFAG